MQVPDKSPRLCCDWPNVLSFALIDSRLLHLPETLIGFPFLSSHVSPQYVCIANANTNANISNNANIFLAPTRYSNHIAS